MVDGGLGPDATQVGELQRWRRPREFAKRLALSEILARVVGSDSARYGGPAGHLLSMALI